MKNTGLVEQLKAARAALDDAIRAAGGGWAMSNIEWTDTTLVHTIRHGSDTRRCEEDCRQEGWVLRSGVRVEGELRPQVVLGLQGLARCIRVHGGSKPLGWAESPVSRVAQGKVHTQAKIGGQRTRVRSASGRRCATGSTASQLLCRSWFDAASENASVRRLRAHLGARGASS